MPACLPGGGTVTRTRFQSHKGVPTSIIPVRYLAEIFKYIRNTLAAPAELFECFQEIAGCISLHYAASITLWILLCRILMRRVDPARAPPGRGPLLLFLAFQTRHLRITTLIGATRDLSDPWIPSRRVSRRFQLVLKELVGMEGDAEEYWMGNAAVKVSRRGEIIYFFFFSMLSKPVTGG